MVCPKFNCNVYKLEGRQLRNLVVSILQLGSKRCFHWEMINFPKTIADGPMNMGLSKKKEKVMNTPMN
jgi:hypothetical protein